jgi:hypothetical protein
MPGLDGSLTDLEILNLDDGPSSPEAQTAPTSSSESTPTTPTAETTETAPAAPATPAVEAADDYAWAKPLLQNPQFADKFKAAQERLAEFQKVFGSVAGAREFKQQLQALGGIGKLGEIKARSDQLDAVDKVYFGNDTEAKRQYLSNLSQQDPARFQTAVANGLAILRQTGPEEYNYIIGPFIAEKLREEGIWSWLEYIYEAAEAGGHSDLVQLLNQFAGLFARHGVGPGRESETGEAAQRRAAFNAETGRMAGEALDSGILAAVNHFAPHVSSDPQLLAAIIDQTHLELQNTARENKHLRHALMNLSHAGISRQVGERTAKLLASKLRNYIPYAVNRVLKDFLPPQEAVAVKVSPTKTKKNVSEGALPQAEADKMSEREVLDSPRIGQRRGTWRPESVLDDKAAP